MMIVNEKLEDSIYYSCHFNAKAFESPELITLYKSQAQYMG